MSSHEKQTTSGSLVFVAAAPQTADGRSDVDVNDADFSFPAGRGDPGVVVTELSEADVLGELHRLQQLGLLHVPDLYRVVQRA